MPDEDNSRTVRSFYMTYSKLKFIQINLDEKILNLLVMTGNTPNESRSSKT